MDSNDKKTTEETNENNELTSNDSITEEKNELKDLKEEMDYKDEKRLKNYAISAVFLNIFLVIIAVIKFAQLLKNTQGIAILLLIFIVPFFCVMALGNVVLANIILGSIFAVPHLSQKAVYNTKNYKLKSKELKSGKYKGVSIDTLEGQKLLKKDTIINCLKPILIGAIVLLLYVLSYYRNLYFIVHRENPGLLIPIKLFQRIKFLIPYTEPKFIIVCLSIMVIVMAFFIISLIPWLKYRKKIKEDKENEETNNQ